jgi:hypothetical protein
VQKGGNSMVMIDGFTNEHQIVEHINRRLFSELNNDLQSLLTKLYDCNLMGQRFSAAIINGQMKPDIVVETGGIRRYISIKIGLNNSVHQESLDCFENFLINNSMPLNIIENLKRFHYGDGTLNGTGMNRYRSTQWIEMNGGEVNEINRMFNESDFLQIALDRFLFRGNVANSPTADAIYHGTYEGGFWATRSEILEHLIPNQSNNIQVHFSNLTYQVWNRNLNFNPNTENRRHTMQIKWSSLREDLHNISLRR